MEGGREGGRKQLGQFEAGCGRNQVEGGREVGRRGDAAQDGEEGACSGSVPTFCFPGNPASAVAMQRQE